MSRLWIVVMDDGLAYDGIYTYKTHAEQVCDFYKSEHKDHKFEVRPVENGAFSMRGKDRIYDYLREQ